MKIVKHFSLFAIAFIIIQVNNVYSGTGSSFEDNDIVTTDQWSNIVLYENDGTASGWSQNFISANALHARCSSRVYSIKVETQDGSTVKKISME